MQVDRRDESEREVLENLEQWSLRGRAPQPAPRPGIANEAPAPVDLDALVRGLAAMPPISDDAWSPRLA